MKWYGKLYISESIGKKANRIKFRINHNVRCISVFVIAFASNPDNLLEIIPSWNLMQKAYPKKDLKIIGLAKGYGEAVELVRQIIDETYRNTGDVDVWHYLKEHRGEAV